MGSMNKEATPTVIEVGKISFTGNIIPHNWYKTLTYENGKPNFNAIIILSEIVYWYRPVERKDEATGQLVALERKFHSDILQRSYKSLANQFGMTKRQVEDAVKYLEDQGLIKRERRVVKISNGETLGNVLFIDLNVKRLKQITHG